MRPWSNRQQCSLRWYKTLVFSLSLAVESLPQYGWQMALAKIIIIINLSYFAELVRWFTWFFSRIFWGEWLYLTLNFLWETANIAESKVFCPGTLHCGHLFGQIRKPSILQKQGDIHPFSQVHCSPKKELLIYKHSLHPAFLTGSILCNRTVLEKSKKHPFLWMLTCLILVA